ncbi:MAG: lema family protein [Janthinobacterium lividum]
MIRWPESLGYWIGAALSLFWLVGAYNRLMRLRSAALQAYATLDAALVRQLDFVQSRTQPESSDAVASIDAAAQASLLGSTVQLSTLLGANRLHPLDPASIAALATALHVMLAAWERLHPDAVLSFGADGTLSRPVPIGLKSDKPLAPSTEIPIAWPEPSPAAEIARQQFNTSVAAYNAAIAQFPALLVAWVMQLRRAAPLSSLV